MLLRNILTFLIMASEFIKARLYFGMEQQVNEENQMSVDHVVYKIHPLRDEIRLNWHQHSELVAQVPRLYEI